MMVMLPIKFNYSTKYFSSPNKIFNNYFKDALIKPDMFLNRSIIY